MTTPHAIEPLDAGGRGHSAMIERDRLADIRAQHADRAAELRRLGKRRMAEYEDEIVAICDEVRQWRLWAAGVITHSPAIVAGRYERPEPGGDR